MIYSKENYKFDLGVKGLRDIVLYLYLQCKRGMAVQHMTPDVCCYLLQNVTVSFVKCKR